MAMQDMANVKVSIKSTSEEAKRQYADQRHMVVPLFPLNQLPKKLKAVLLNSAKRKIFRFH